MFKFLKRFFKKKQSAELTQFYREYAAWLEGNCKFHPHFVKGCGLCSSLRRWSGAIGSEYNEMKKQFSDAGLCEMYPFNNKDSYYAEASTGTAHLNEKRRQWVFNHAK